MGTTRVTFTGNHFAGSPETAVLEVKREVRCLSRRSVALPSRPSDAPS
ncbi:hypothetical protein VULLAG_LOCUS18977 [Vulpes lagopus]